MAPTTRADNKNKHPGYCVSSKPPQTTQSPSKMKAKSQLEQDTIVNDIAALEAQLHTKQQQLRSMASQPPGPSQGKQRHPPLVPLIVVVISPIPVPIPIPSSLSSLSPLSLSLFPSPRHCCRCLPCPCPCSHPLVIVVVVSPVPVPVPVPIPSSSSLCHGVTVIPVSSSTLVSSSRVVLAFARPILLSLSSWCWHGRTAMLLSLCWHGRAAIVVVVMLLWHLPWASCRCHLHHVAVAFAMGILSLSSSSCCCGICHGHLVVVIFIMLA